MENGELKVENSEKKRYNVLKEKTYLLADCEEILRILSASIITSKSRLRK